MKLAPVIGLTLLLTATAAAATFNVNRTNDAVDTNPGDGNCTAAGGGCTLRAAIQEANVLGGGPHTVRLQQATYTLTLAGAGEDAAASGDLDLLAPMSIIGNLFGTSIIDGNGADRVFHHQAGEVTISSVVIRNGSAANGGGIFADGSTLNIADTIIENNAATGSGGGLFSSSSVETCLDRSIVRSNTAGTQGGGVYTDQGFLRVEDSDVLSNSAPMGAGLSIASPGPAGQFSGNETACDCSAVVLDSLLRNNEAGGDGGAIHHSSNLELLLENSTATENMAARGGGIWAPGDDVWLRNSTVARNNGGGLGGTTARMSNSIIGLNSASDCQQTTIQSLGNNIDSDGSCGLGGGGDLSSTDPLLSPFRELLIQRTEGEVTPLPGSPAIDGGNNNTCTVFDRGGSFRPSDGDFDGTATCDIGAHEVLPRVLEFSQFGGGQGLGSDLVFYGIPFNALIAADTVFGIVQFFDPDGNPLEVDIAGVGPATEVPFEFSNLGSATISTAPGGDDLVIGSARALFDESSVPGAFIRFSIAGLGPTAVPGAVGTRKAMIPVRRNPTINSGIALRNTASRNCSYNLSLREDGVEVAGGFKRVGFGAFARTAQFIDEIFTAADTSDFDGTLVIDGTGEPAACFFTALGLELGNAPGDFTTLPPLPIF